MLYKVTPTLPDKNAEKKERKAREPGVKRKKRGAAVYDADGNEVLITLMCLKCHKMRPLIQFGLRKMADGAIRNQPWCRKCRSEARPEPNKVAEAEATAAEAEAAADAAQALAPEATLITPPPAAMESEPSELVVPPAVSEVE